MKPPSGGSRARVLGAALRNWAAHTADPTPPVARLQIRQPPDWSYVNAVNLTEQALTGLPARRPHRLPARAAIQSRPRHPRLRRLPRRTARRRPHPPDGRADLLDAAPRVGRPRAWIAAHVTHLINTGQLRETRRPGVFRI